MRLLRWCSIGPCSPDWTCIHNHRPLVIVVRDILEHVQYLIICLIVMWDCKKVFLPTKMTHNASWSLLSQMLEAIQATSPMAARHDLWNVDLTIIFVPTFWTGAPRLLIEITQPQIIDWAPWSLWQLEESYWGSGSVGSSLLWDFVFLCKIHGSILI